MYLERYCRCGGVLRVRISKEDKDAALARWFAAHQGAQCRPATRKQAQEAKDGR